MKGPETALFYGLGRQKKASKIGFKRLFFVKMGVCMGCGGEKVIFLKNEGGGFLGVWSFLQSLSFAVGPHSTHLKAP